MPDWDEPALARFQSAGAGAGELVLITQGSSARLTPETKNLPIDTVVVGIVDTVHIGPSCVFNRQEKPVEPS